MTDNLQIEILQWVRENIDKRYMEQKMVKKDLVYTNSSIKKVTEEIQSSISKSIDQGFLEPKTLDLPVGIKLEINQAPFNKIFNKIMNNPVFTVKRSPPWYTNKDMDDLCGIWEEQNEFERNQNPDKIIFKVVPHATEKDSEYGLNEYESRSDFESQFATCKRIEPSGFNYKEPENKYDPYGLTDKQRKRYKSRVV